MQKLVRTLSLSLALVLMLAVLAGTAAAASPDARVIVRSGETLSALCADRNRFSEAVWNAQKCVDWAAARNALADPNVIRVGQELALPAAGLVEEPATVAELFYTATTLRVNFESAQKDVSEKEERIASLKKQLAEAEGSLGEDKKNLAEKKAASDAALKAAEDARAKTVAVVPTASAPAATSAVATRQVATTATPVPAAVAVPTPTAAVTPVPAVVAPEILARLDKIADAIGQANKENAESFQKLENRLQTLENRPAAPAGITQQQLNDAIDRNTVEVAALRAQLRWTWGVLISGLLGGFAIIGIRGIRRWWRAHRARRAAAAVPVATVSAVGAKAPAAQGGH